MPFTLDEVRAHWDHVAPIYDQANSHWLNPHEWRFIEGITYLEPSLSEEVKVLSLWSRTGNAVPFIRSVLPNARIFNFEASNRMIQQARRLYPGEQFSETDLKTIDLPDQSVDYIMSPETLEHTPDPPALIGEFHRVLKDDGRLILSLPPRIADFHQWVYETLIGGHGDGPRKGIPSWVVKPWLAEAGFDLQLHRSILMFPIGPLWFIRLGNSLTRWLPFLKELGVMQFYICGRK